MGSQQIYLLYLFLLVVVEGYISFGKEKQKQIKSKYRYTGDESHRLYIRPENVTG